MKKLLLLILILSVGKIDAQYKWTVVSKMPYPVWGGQLAYDTKAQGTKIYILGGFSDSLQKPVNWIQEYDVSNNKWSLVGHMLQARSQFVADVWNNKIVYFGDSLNSNKNLEAWDLLGKDSSSVLLDTNTTLTRAFPTGNVVGDIFYIIGGSPPLNTSLPYIVGYNLSTKQIDLFSSELTVGKPSQHMSFVVGNNIYIFGGTTIGVDRTISRFNIIPTKGLLTLPTTLIENRAEGAAVFNATIQKGFIIGGYKEPGIDSVLSSVEIVDVKSDGSLNVSKGPSLNYARRNLMAVNYKGKIAVFGGQDKDGKVVPWVEILDTLATDVVNKPGNLYTSFELNQNYPNPFNPSTTISFQLYKRASILLDIYSVLGQHVITLMKGEYDAGKYSTQWNGLNKFNNLVPSGIYFLQLRAGNLIQTQKMVLLK